jgi:hypothetical protein
MAAGCGLLPYDFVLADHSDRNGCLAIETSEMKETNGANVLPADPLHSDRVVPDRARELFGALSQCANGFSSDEVANAAINLLLNSIRQSHATQNGAARAFDEMAGRAKHLLLEAHYHGDGKRRNIFPYTQHLDVCPPGWSKTKIR